MKAHQKPIRKLLAEAIFDLHPACCNDKHIDKIHSKLMSIFITNHDAPNQEKLESELQEESLWWNGKDEKNSIL